MDQSAGHYEFSAQQNRVLRKAATWTRLFAWIMMISAGLMAIGGILTGEASSIGALIVAAVYFLVGFTFRGAAVSMSAVVQTAGNDIEHLMAALEKLGSAFKVMSILFLIGVILFVAVTVSIWYYMASLATA
jgi:hypothetical protein